MPRKAIDYSKTIMYNFVCSDKNITDTYVGHTTDFARRKSTHKCHCINETDKKHHLKLYQNIREKGGWENWTMTPLEEYPCENNLQARIREQYWMDILQAKMNHIKAFSPEQEYRKMWKSQKFVCECGVTVGISHKARHLKSLNHKSPVNV